MKNIVSFRQDIQLCWWHHCSCPVLVVTPWSVTISHLVLVAGNAATVLRHRDVITPCFVLILGNVVVTSMRSGLYVVQPDYEAMQAAANNKTYGEQTRYLQWKQNHRESTLYKIQDQFDYFFKIHITFFTKIVAIGVDNTLWHFFVGTVTIRSRWDHALLTNVHSYNLLPWKRSGIDYCYACYDSNKVQKLLTWIGVILITKIFRLQCLIFSAQVVSTNNGCHILKI